MVKVITSPLKIKFEGNHTSDSILIGNHADAKFFANGTFNLSGMVYNRKTVEFTIAGTGTIKLHGYCKRVVIHLVKGDCVIDFSELYCKEVTCISLRDKSQTIIGQARVITMANLQDEAVLRYSGEGVLKSFSTAGNSRVERFEVAPHISSIVIA